MMTVPGGQRWPANMGVLSSWPQWTQSTWHPCSTTRSASPWCASTAGQRASVALDAAATRWSGTGMTTHSRIGSGIGEYARDEDGDGFCEVHVNTMEGVWS